jgi:hypothetical protein
VNAIQKPLFGLKNVLQKPQEAFQGFTGFTNLHAKLYAIHCKQNETQSQKSTRVKTVRVHSAMSHGRLMQ